MRVPLVKSATSEIPQSRASVRLDFRETVPKPGGTCARPERTAPAQAIRHSPFPSPAPSEVSRPEPLAAGNPRQPFGVDDANDVGQTPIAAILDSNEAALIIVGDTQRPLDRCRSDASQVCDGTDRIAAFATPSAYKGVTDIDALSPSENSPPISGGMHPLPAHVRRRAMFDFRFTASSIRHLLSHPLPSLFRCNL